MEWFPGCCYIDNKPLHHCPRVLLHCPIHDMNRWNSCWCRPNKADCLFLPRPFRHTPGRWCSQCLPIANSRQPPSECHCLSSSPKAQLMIRMPRPADTGYCLSRIQSLTMSCRPRFSRTSCIYRPYKTGCPPFQASCLHSPGWSMRYQSKAQSREWRQSLLRWTARSHLQSRSPSA